MQRERIYAALFSKLSALAALTATDEPHTIPATPYRVNVLWYGRYTANVYVKRASNGATFTQIMSGTPTTGQYIVDSSGMYTFAAADSGVGVIITYTYQGIVTAGRSLVHFSDLSPAFMPALYMVQKSETNTQVRGLPASWQFEVDIYLYINCPNDPNFIPTQLLNPLLDEIENFLAPDSPDYSTCTLGGLVSHCWISAPIVTSEGQLSELEIAIVPINILVPS